eukprot:14728_1
MISRQKIAPVVRTSVRRKFIPARNLGFKRSFSVKTIQSEKDFNTVVKDSKDQLLVVDWKAEWCNPCKTLHPELEKFSESHTDINFISVDVDDFQELAAEHKVSSLPTIQFFRESMKVDVVVGANPDLIKEKLLLHSPTK